jgi:hypothetical protein
VFLFLLLCIVTILAGVGILAALRVPIRAEQRWLLAPAACLSVWAVVLGVTISFGMTARALVVPFWTGTAIAVFYGSWTARRSCSREILLLLAVAVVLPIVLMPFDFLHGLSDFIGGPAPDGWSYVSRAQQLWEMPKNTMGHLAPLHEYARHMYQTRFISPALIAVMSPFARKGGDTQAAVGYFIALAVFIFGASCLAAASTSSMRWRPLAIFCALAVCSRWLLGAIQIHNYDNLLGISFLPMTMGLVAALEAPNRRATVVLGLFVGAATYTYPEMAIFPIVGLALSALRRASADPRGGRWAVMTVAAVALAAVLAIPDWRDFVWFMATQVGNATAAIGHRPGEGAFSELLSIPGWLTAVWGLTGGATVRFGWVWSVGSRGLGLVCWILVAIGWVELLRQRIWDVALIGVMLMVGAVVMVVSQQYSYGAYKFLLLGWWIFAWCVTAGANALIERGRTRFRATGRIGRLIAAGAMLAMVLIGLFGALAGRIVSFQRQLTVQSIRPYRAVIDVEREVGRAPILLTVNDPAASEWAVYFLRDHAVRLLGYRGPMAYAHVVRFMDEAAVPDFHAIQYVLTDAQPAPSRDILWQEGPYALLRIPQTGAALLGQVNNPNGAEQLDGQSFYWIGEGDTKLEVHATAAGTAIFLARFILGPSLPDRPDRRLMIGSPDASAQTITIARNGDQSFSFPVHEGENEIYIRPLDRPSVKLPADSRPLLLGVQGLRVSLGPADQPGQLP